MRDQKQQNHNQQKKIALVNDFTGFGRCSIAVQLPVISMMKVQCCAVPTAIFSDHTAYDSFYCTDYTAEMEPYIEEWKKLRLKFQGICTGFLGSEEQIRIVSEFINTFKEKDTTVVVDPGMDDGGERYATYTEEMCRKMSEVVQYADIVVPNVTEACLLTGTQYKEEWSIGELERLAEKIAGSGPAKVVITGIEKKNYVANLCYEKGAGYEMIQTEKIGSPRSGTGDIFAAIIAADAVNGTGLTESVRKASGFIGKCIQRSVELEIPLADGICFEELLYLLK